MLATEFKGTGAISAPATLGLIAQIDLVLFLVTNQGSVTHTRFFGIEALYASFTQTNLPLTLNFPGKPLQKKLRLLRLEQFKPIIHSLKYTALPICDKKECGLGPGKQRSRPSSGGLA